MSSKPTYKDHIIFNDSLIAVLNKITSVKFNKPINLGMCILDFSKLLMYTRGQKSGILQFMSLFFNYCETMVLKVGSLFRKAVLLVPICEFYK